MKTTKNCLRLLIISLILTVITSCKADHVLTLHVDTSVLSPANISAACSFTTGPGTIVLDSIPVEDFTIQAVIHDRIRWQGTAHGHSISVKMIKHESGPAIFKRDTYQGSKRVCARVRSNTPGMVAHKYSLFFSVDRDPRVYKIDPKIMVR